MQIIVIDQIAEEKKTVYETISYHFFIVGVERLFD